MPLYVLIQPHCQPGASAATYISRLEGRQLSVCGDTSQGLPPFHSLSLGSFWLHEWDPAHEWEATFTQGGPGPGEQQGEFAVGEQNSSSTCACSTHVSPGPDQPPSWPYRLGSCKIGLIDSPPCTAGAAEGAAHAICVGTDCCCFRFRGQHLTRCAPAVCLLPLRSCMTGASMCSAWTSTRAGMRSTTWSCPSWSTTASS